MQKYEVELTLQGKYKQTVYAPNVDLALEKVEKHFHKERPIVEWDIPESDVRSVDEDRCV